MEAIRTHCNRLRKNKKFLIGYLGVVLLVPLGLLLLPDSFFDEGQSVCLSVALFHQKCYACGMTRAIQHLIHLDILAAWQYNKLSVIVLPLLIYIWIEEVRRVYKKIRMIR